MSPAKPRAPLAPGDPVSLVPGVGASRAEAFARLGVATVEDLLRLAPRRFEDRRRPLPAASLLAGAEGTWVGTLSAVKTVRARGGLVIVEARGADATGEVRARWFNQPWLSSSLAAGVRVLLHGPVQRRGTAAELASPAVERLPDDDAPHPGVGRLVPVHPLTTGLSALAVRRAVWTAMEAASRLEDVVPPALRAATEDGSLVEPLPSLPDAVRALHFPAEPADAEVARRRLAFDELLVHELMLGRRRARRVLSPGVPLRFTPELERRIRARLPFTPTPAQEQAMAEVRADLERPTPMNRLLQGDVGAGKTFVAVHACLAAVANGHQAAFMAPTEVLARQHEATLRRMLDGSDVRIEALYGARRGAARAQAVARVAAGEADLVVGTHAVLSRDVVFADLALVVVDEQHKFGVRQRRELVSKGRAPHCLVMTATPIPRTLAMVVFGDLDVTVLRGLPPGRGRRETVVVGPSGGERVMARVREELARGHQVLVVYPLVEESDRVGLRDATAGRDAWARALPHHVVGLVHGKMKADARHAAMDAFRAGTTHVLVSTVVVEVGVDVPNATVLVVEHAERFGLSQLHQLRGRVGRSAAGGLCVLVDRTAGETPDRLRTLERTEDGFEIAEEDLRLRGAGDLFGTRQHGAPAFVAARFPDDLPVLLRARAAARRVLADPRADRDPALARLSLRVAAREALAGDVAAGG
ncbi:MAG: ATP-dependent DNA helicase RecG [Planctomycetes bacterium]|nr:ATP-dependent DNA helicase RecG [Planctomycetota bacterium]